MEKEKIFEINRLNFMKSEDERGSILPLVLIVGATASLLGLAFMQYSLLEARTARQFKLTQDLFYLAESGIEMGLTALQADPAYSDPFTGFLNAEEPDKGTFKVVFFRRDSGYDYANNKLPQGYKNLSELSSGEVFIRSEGIIKEGSQERTLELWALVEKGPLYNKALFSDNMLHIKGLSKSSEFSHNTAGIYGDVHINERLYIESSEWTDRNIIRKCPVSGEKSGLTYSAGSPLTPVNIWGSSGVPRLLVEVGSSEGGQFLPEEGPDGEGGYFSIYNRIATSQRFSPESAGFKDVPRLRFDFYEYKQKLLSLVQENNGADMILEIPGNDVWNNDNIHLYNGKVTRVHGDLKMENSVDNGLTPLDPLFFDGVVVVEGMLTFRHYRHENKGSEQKFRGIFIADDIRCTYDYLPDEPPDSAHTHLEIEGFIMAKNIFSVITTGMGGEESPMDQRIIRGTIAAGEVFLQGPYTRVYYDRPENLIPEYTNYLPETDVVIRKLFKPYLMEE